MQSSHKLLIAGGAAVVSLAAYFMFGAEENEEKVKKQILVMCSEEKLLNILEDLRIEYTPYYTHYYHMLVTLQKEYSDKPILCKKL